MILIPLVTLLLSQGSEWSIEHNTIEQGPTTIHDGLVRLQMTEEDPHPCMSAVLVVGKGVLSGPPTSSNPGKPLIPFDTWEVVEGGIRIEMCRVAPSWPLAQERQVFPVATIRRFHFYITKQEFDGSDLAKLLADWGKPDSYWDLDGDGTVNGLDLTILLSRWGSS